MRTLYIDCGMGAAGDQAGIPGVEIIKEPAVKCGITGTHMRVLVNGVEEGAVEHHHHHDHDHEHGHTHDHDHSHTHDHVHSGMADIEHIVRGHLDIPEAVKDDVMNVYGLIAEAESHAHGVPVTQIHFHEVGTMDAVADITMVAMLMHEIAPDQVVASAVHVGSGTVKCAHGTPTGAALLKYFVNRFGEMPVMRVEAIGYGMGTKDFDAANCLRVMLGESEDQTDMVTELSCNVDDMTAEEIGFAMEKLFAGGAFEVFTVPAGMKKNRPGTLITVICRQQDKESIVKLIFKYTSTIGIREKLTTRYVLERREEEFDTPYGSVRLKTSEGYGVRKKKYEYEALARIANERGMTLQEARKLIGE